MSHSLRKFFKNTRGVASLEFVMIAPVLCLLLLGIYQYSQLVRAKAKLSSVAVSVADLVAQQANGVTIGTGGSLGNFCKAAELMMAPFPTGATNTTFSLAIASVSNYAPGTVSVDWEVDTACTTTAPAMGATAISLANAPVNLVPTVGDSVIMVRANYTYSTLIPYFAPAVTARTTVGFARPRANGVVACTPACP